MRLALATVFTLGLLATMLAAVVVGFMYAAGVVNFTAAVIAIVVINLVMWLVGPWFSDWQYRFFYDMRWIDMDALREKSPAAADTIEAVTQEYGFDTPKLGIIDDGNPNAFTYGSGRWNARIIATEGIFEYLDDDEVAAVYAHELGHITNRDFIVMTIANTLVQLLYIIAIRAYRTALQSDSNSRGRGQAMLLGVAVMSYLFFIIGQYVERYLSRIREYYADAFAARHTDPNLLATALMKIAYGIVLTEDSKELTKATQTLGVMNFNQAEDKGMIYHNTKDAETQHALEQSFLFDLKNPWARLLELTSTHPLTGKRIKTLCSMTKTPVFDFDKIERQYQVDTGHLRKQFLKDLAMLHLPKTGFIGVLGLYGLAYTSAAIPAAHLQAVGGALLALGLGMIARNRYRYPGDPPEQSTVLDLMTDVYASPVRGAPVQLDGEIVGRGQAGYAFSEDMMFKDDTGLMYLQYESWLGGLGNMLFAWRGINDYLGNDVALRGWYFRGLMPHVGLRRIASDTDETTSALPYLGLAGGAVIALIGLGITLLPLLP